MYLVLFSFIYICIYVYIFTLLCGKLKVQSSFCRKHGLLFSLKLICEYIPVIN